MSGLGSVWVVRLPLEDEGRSYSGSGDQRCNRVARGVNQTDSLGTTVLAYRPSRGLGLHFLKFNCLVKASLDAGVCAKLLTLAENSSDHGRSALSCDHAIREFIDRYRFETCSLSVRPS